jgi:cytochrome c oxidase assembly protein subunit 11
MAAGFALAMLGLSFVAAPAYRAFCRATGFAGATVRADQGPTARSERRMVVRFDANVAHDLPWRFQPEVPKVKIHVGEVATVIYKVENLSDHETRGLAAFNVTPGQAGAYFNKLACFCFQEQRLGPHEKAEWAVVFFLDPALEEEAMMNGVEEVTLSYTFFPSAKSADARSVAAPVAKKPVLN